MEIVRVEAGGALWRQLAAYAQRCSWVAGAHLAKMMRQGTFSEWESVFAAVDDGEIAGFCTFLKTDYYPENRYSPWISTIFVGEAYRGHRLSGRMIESVIAYARKQGFSRVYIPSDICGLYEKYGFVRIDELVNYGGDTDGIFERII